jgi:hypothetical protein
MKNIPIAELSQVFSRRMDTRPDYVWCVEINGSRIGNIVIDECNDRSTGWTGWAFLISGAHMEYTKAFLVFENKEDAVMVKLAHGEISYAD